MAEKEDRWRSGEEIGKLGVSSDTVYRWTTSMRCPPIAWASFESSRKTKSTSMGRRYGGTVQRTPKPPLVNSFL